MAARRLLLALLPFLALPLACNLALSDGGALSKGAPARDVTFNESDASPEARVGTGTSGGEPGAPSPQKALRGSPLCNAPQDGGTCWPDETRVAAAACGATASDAGDAGADAGHAPLACRMRVYDDDRQPSCGAAGGGSDGDKCLRSSDCAAGFECVQSPGRCRPYCCSLKCDDDQRFCDQQPTAASTEQPGLLVPVCATVETCRLLSTSCGTDRTCGVVRADGTTSCVATGKARAGEGCELEPCGADLVCLGQPSVRRCYKLCQSADARACPTGQTCRGTAPLFKEGTIGVCE